ncbi:MAG: CbiQ family ECF transporter T component [Azonexus sp.]|nr:CbiQ family ECF transporter T component [Azonexus sp.]
MHPSCALIIWLAAVVGVQFVGYAGLLLLVAGLLLLTPALIGRWWAYVRRARWLLLTLWLILAYNTPGEALHDLAWAPTFEGMAEANLQAARLVTMLACLAWLFLRLGHEGMIAGSWGLLQPVRALGFDSERVVVRLSLVLENLQEPLEKGAWKQMLVAQPSVLAGQESLHLSLAPWHLRDSLLVALSGLGLMGAAWL